jgi:hypothetical protein
MFLLPDPELSKTQASLVKLKLLGIGEPISTKVDPLNKMLFIPAESSYTPLVIVKFVLPIKFVQVDPEPELLEASRFITKPSLLAKEEDGIKEKIKGIIKKKVLFFNNKILELIWFENSEDFMSTFSIYQTSQIRVPRLTNSFAR